VNAELIRAQAQQEVDMERFLAAVEAEKARLRTRKTLGQRLAALLPFTVTITRKSK
jgi:hypothetical protein